MRLGRPCESTLGQSARARPAASRAPRIASSARASKWTCSERMPGVRSTMPAMRWALQILEQCLHLEAQRQIELGRAELDQQIVSRPLRMHARERPSACVAEAGQARAAPPELPCADRAAALRATPRRTRSTDRPAELAELPQIRHRRRSRGRRSRRGSGHPAPGSPACRRCSRCCRWRRRCRGCSRDAGPPRRHRRAPSAASARSAARRCGWSCSALPSPWRRKHDVIGREEIRRAMRPVDHARSATAVP